MSGAAPSASSPWPSLGVVVPVYNEEVTIRRSCHAIADVLKRYPGRAVIVAVDDGSRDASTAILDELDEELDELVVEHHEANAGYGAAQRTGSKLARRLELDYVAFIDSDLTNPPQDLLKIGRLAAGGADYIKASRFAPGGGMSGVPVSRRGMTRLGNLVAAPLFGAGLRDVTNGFRAVRTDLVCEWPLAKRDFSVIVEELDWALRTGVRPVEFPTVLSARSGEQRPTAFDYSPRLALSYLRFALRAFARRLKNRGGRPTTSR